MCPACIGSALVLLTGASSAGGVALIASRVLGTRPPAPPPEGSQNQGAKQQPQRDAQA
jgi:hypothetical protein